MGLGLRIRNNLPANKPELWRQPVRALMRRLSLKIQAGLDPKFYTRPFIATLLDGDLVMEVTPGETQGATIALSGIYELAPTELVVAFLEPGDHFVDVGANIGYYTLLAARRVGPAGKVTAFEPYPPVRERLQRNIALNRLENVEIIASCAGEMNGQTYLAAPKHASNAGTATMQRAPAGDSIEVAVVRLDEALPGPPPALIKVDVEGNEASVFAGAKAWLSAEEGPTILFESFRSAEDAAILMAHGYEVWVPILRQGRVGLLPWSRDTARYRAWEAPNYLATKSKRGKAFAARFQVPA
jgi:FkbM family methyltransferase